MEGFYSAGMVIHNCRIGHQTSNTSNCKGTHISVGVTYTLAVLKILTPKKCLPTVAPRFELPFDWLEIWRQREIQGCQMVHKYIFTPKISICVYFGGSWNWKCWYILWHFGICYDNFVHFNAIWYILRQFGTFWGNLVYFPVLVYCTKKDLATLYVEISKFPIRQFLFYEKGVRWIKDGFDKSGFMAAFRLHLHFDGFLFSFFTFYLCLFYITVSATELMFKTYLMSFLHERASSSKNTHMYIDIFTHMYSNWFCLVGPSWLI
jgi:hypothetical protein